MDFEDVEIHQLHHFGCLGREPGILKGKVNGTTRYQNVIS